jgi:peroxiredoxin
MSELREFAQHKSEFDALNTRVVGISTDPTPDARKAWDQVTNRQFTLVSDPGLKVIREYGLVHSGGRGRGQDIALRATLLIGPDGRERWRQVSHSVFDTPSAPEVLQRIRATS